MLCSFEKNGCPTLPTSNTSHVYKIPSTTYSTHHTPYKPNSPHTPINTTNTTQTTPPKIPEQPFALNSHRFKLNRRELAPIRWLLHLSFSTPQHFKIRFNASRTDLFTVIKAFSCVALLPVILSINTSTNW